MTGTEETLTESGIPIRSQLARFRVSGTGRGRGIVFLYPDKLAAVQMNLRQLADAKGGAGGSPLTLSEMCNLLHSASLDVREVARALHALAALEEKCDLR